MVDTEAEIVAVARQNVYLKSYFGEGSLDQPLSNVTQTKQWVASGACGIGAATGKLKTFQSDNEGGLHSSKIPPHFDQTQFLNKFLGTGKNTPSVSGRSSIAVSVASNDKLVETIKPISKKPEVPQKKPDTTEKKVVKVESKPEKQENTELSTFEQFISGVAQVKPEITSELRLFPEQIEETKLEHRVSTELDSGFIHEQSFSNDVTDEILIDMIKNELEGVPDELDSGYFIEQEEEIKPEIEEIVESEITPIRKTNSMMSQLLAEKPELLAEPVVQAPAIIRSQIHVSPNRQAIQELKQHHAELSDLSMSADKV